MFNVLLFLIPVIGDYGTINLKYGVGALHSKDSQVASLGYQSQLHKGIAHQFEIGGWPDQISSRNPSMYGSYSLGLRILKPNYYLESMHGIGMITHTDRLLGGRFQFFHDIGAGIRDRDGYSMGLLVKHISSAGVTHPNIGRNFVVIKLGFPIK